MIVGASVVATGASWDLADRLLRVRAQLLHHHADGGVHTEVDILDEFTGLARNRMWQSRQVLGALDDFAARAGRRGG